MLIIWNCQTFAYFFSRRKNPEDLAGRLLQIKSHTWRRWHSPAGHEIDVKSHTCNTNRAIWFVAQGCAREFNLRNKKPHLG